MIVVTALQTDVDVTWVMVVGGLIGAVLGAAGARRVKMTAMPQMVAAFNGVGGGAASLVTSREFHNRAPIPGHLQTTSRSRSCSTALIELGCRSRARGLRSQSSRS